MNISNVKNNQWKEIREIYFEAFPKAERKPFFTIKRSVKKGRAQLLTAANGDILQGFVMVIPYGAMAMVDYLAVSGKDRSRGTGSKIIQEVCKRFSDKKIVLLIERTDENAENKEQRIARRKFYLKNGFTSSDIYITGKSGNMELLNYGSAVSLQEYMNLQRYTLGRLMFWLSGIKPAI
jgi:GNAT superfamily N-acetyltransferase